MKEIDYLPETRHSCNECAYFHVDFKTGVMKCKQCSIRLMRCVFDPNACKDWKLRGGKE